MARYNVFSGDPHTEDAGDVSQLATLYPLYPSRDFNATFPFAAWDIGFQNEYPEELKRRLCAALISMQLGLKSVDYTIKHYLDEVEFKPAPREDTEVAAFLLGTHSFLYDLVSKLTHHDDPCAGRILAEWALLRQEFSFGMS